MLDGLSERGRAKQLESVRCCGPGTWSSQNFLRMTENKFIFYLYWNKDVCCILLTQYTLIITDFSIIGQCMMKNFNKIIYYTHDYLRLAYYLWWLRFTRIHVIQQWLQYEFPEIDPVIKNLQYLIFIRVW